MADASGISDDTLAWTSQWYLRQDTLRAANARLVNAPISIASPSCGAAERCRPGDGERIALRDRSILAGFAP